ncbi:hypothetical protein BaRGS_00039119 [Batillaria attramentaria]|uniref:Transposase n=2 Tax=Batillaria attramentaria TaxID=370345 RepID=A0ABD0J3Z3_9CAEN
MLRLQPLMLFGFVAIFSLSLSDADRGDVHVFCEMFKDGQPSHCTCTINKTEVDSEKCDSSHPVETVLIDRTTHDIATIMCHFSNYTTGTVHSSDLDANCSLHGSRDDEYILKFETIANKSRDEGAHVNCNVSCLDANLEHGLTISYEGVPIQFGNASETARTPESHPTADENHLPTVEAVSAPKPEPFTSAKEADLKSNQKKLKRQDRKAAVLKELANFLPRKTVQFIASQLRAVDKKKKGVRWTEKDKTVALSLFHSSPKAYRRLKKIFLLPSVSTLRRSLQNIELYPGFNSKILSALSIKVKSLPPGNELCVLIFDEVSIKEGVSYDPKRDRVEGLEDCGTHGRGEHIANHALVFMLRGLRANWKQPLGYFLTSGTVSGQLLHSLILDCISRVEEAGLNVKAVVADQGSNNRNAFSVGLGVTEEEPFFVFNGKKVFVMFDPPHLLKNVRNNLKNTGFTVEDEEVSWEHVVEFYKFDKMNPVRMAPRLRERHISLPAFSTLRVRYAAQVLSHSVAAGMSSLVQLQVLPHDALATAAFIERFDQLFNAFNSSNLKSKQVMGHAMSLNSGHIEFLQDTLAWLETVKTKSSRALPCLCGWKMAIRGLLALWEDLHNNHGFKFLLTSRLNQDCVENLFSRIRGHAGGVYNPTPAAFRAILRQVMVDQIFDHSDKSNCQEDSAHFLLNMSAIRSVAEALPGDSPADRSPEDEAYLNELLMLSTPPPLAKDPLLVKAECNVLVYIAGYVAKKLQLKVCSACVPMLAGAVSATENEIFLVNKQYGRLDIEGRGLTVPSPELLQAVQRLEESFVATIDSTLRGDSVKACLVKTLHPTFEMVCPEGKCAIKQFIIDKFINIRLHSTLKDINESFTQKGLKRNKKVMKFCCE